MTPSTDALTWIERAWRCEPIVALRKLILLGLVTILPVSYASHFLLKLSGNALWLPREWRLTVQILGVTLGLGVFGWVRARHKEAAARSHAPEEGHGSAEYGRAIRLLLLATVLLVASLGARAQSVVPGSPPQWWIAASAERALPPFIDLEHGTIFVPMSWPEDWERRFRLYEAAADNVARMDGLMYVLAYSPDELFDWLSHEGQWRLAFATLVFLVLHLGTLGAAAAALGLTLSPATTIGKLLASLSR